MSPEEEGLVSKIFDCREKKKNRKYVSATGIKLRLSMV